MAHSISLARGFVKHFSQNSALTNKKFFLKATHDSSSQPVIPTNVPTASIDANTGRITGSPGDFGRVISTSNNARLIQFAVKLNF